MSALLEKLGGRIRTLRQVKGYTQENLADMLGMSVSGFAKIERGESDISLTRIEEVAQALGITGSELLNTGDVTNYQNSGNGAYTLYGPANFNGTEQEMENLKKIVTGLQQTVEELQRKVG